MLLAIPEYLFGNSSNDKGDPVWSLTLGDGNKNITGERTYMVI